MINIIAWIFPWMMAVFTYYYYLTGKGGKYAWMTFKAKIQSEKVSYFYPTGKLNIYPEKSSRVLALRSQLKQKKCVLYK